MSLKSFYDRPDWMLALLSGIITGLAYQPWSLGFLMWIGFIPLIHIWFKNESKNNGVLGYLFGITHNFIAFYWIGLNSGASFWIVLLSLIAAVIYLGVYWAIIGWAFGKLKGISNSIIIFPFLVVTMEWVRSFGSLGFPWGNIVLTQLDYIDFVQIMEITGSAGITFWVSLTNVVIYLITKDFNKNKKYGLALIFGSLAIGIFGNIQKTKYENSDKNIDVAIIQPNLDPNEKWNFNKRKETIAFMDSLVQEAINLDPDLILLPETAYPAYLVKNKSIRKRIQLKVDSSKVPILIGTVHSVIQSTGEKNYFNSSILLSPDNDFILYNKIHLVPFAEYIPLSWKFPFLKNLNFGQGNFKKGNDYTVFNVDNYKFSNLICYESSIPQLVRIFIKKNIDFITIQTNDGWLGKSSGPFQHFDIARIRAIENRVPIVRSANTGISGLILSNGKIDYKQSLDQLAVFMVSIPIFKTGSFYTIYGDIFVLLCLILFIISGPIQCLKSRF